MDGLLLLSKPISWTSHDLVDCVRRKTGIRAVGHAGTLDPMATGLMLLLIGNATKRSNSLMGLEKTYRGSIRLGVVTDTWDLEGKIVEEKTVPDLDAAALRRSFAALTGEQLLPTPIYSAVKIAGRKAYALARRGEAVEPEPRRMRIDRFDVESFESPEIYFSMDCSKGTYVRSVAYTLGSRLGCGAALSSLVRTRIDDFRLEDAMDQEAFLKATPDILQGRLK